ncbi:uncharacterized protein LOC118433217 [Folsomia candida]|uniref:uncharacterized protein LOC118433217 n=1 Tax=Folsomia candida TaxID=158441 RepID=UPI001604F5FF|nr:uncharacterized protein LOC118433217 [Folsomia candida]
MSYSDKFTRPHPITSLILRILTVFRHVESLTLSDLPDWVLEENAIPLRRLKSLAVIRAFYYERTGPPSPVKNVANFSHVTRLEVNPQIGDNPEGQPNLLDILAPQLKHLCISYVPAFPTWPDHRREDLRVPILPKLKVLKIVRKDEDELYAKDGILIRDISLKFATEELIYAKQFPVLERLIVRMEFPVTPEMGDWGRENCSPEGVRVFMCSTFLAKGISPCETLRSLDISFPSEQDLRCGCRDEVSVCTCEQAEFYEKVARTFPNVGCDLVEKRRRKERVRKFEKFVEFGSKFGFLRDPKVREIRTDFYEEMKFNVE